MEGKAAILHNLHFKAGGVTAIWSPDDEDDDDCGCTWGNVLVVVAVGCSLLLLLLLFEVLLLLILFGLVLFFCSSSALLVSKWRVPSLTEVISTFWKKSSNVKTLFLERTSNSISNVVWLMVGDVCWFREESSVLRRGGRSDRIERCSRIDWLRSCFFRI